MDARIQVLSGDVLEEVMDLWEWLRSERELTGTVQAVRKPPVDGELGGAIDVLAVALGSGGTGVVLVKSLTTWLRTRQPHVSLTVKTKTGSVTLEARNVDRHDVLPMLERVLRDRDV